MLEFLRAELVESAPARCGWCKRVVDGDTTMTALASEAYAAHPDSFVRGGYNGEHDYELFSCADGTGCLAGVTA